MLYSILSKEGHRNTLFDVSFGERTIEDAIWGIFYWKHEKKWGVHRQWLNISTTKRMSPTLLKVDDTIHNW